MMNGHHNDACLPLLPPTSLSSLPSPCSMRFGEVVRIDHVPPSMYTGMAHGFRLHTKIADGKVARAADAPDGTVSTRTYYVRVPKVIG